MRDLQLFYNLSNRLVLLLNEQGVNVDKWNNEEVGQNKLEVIETVDELYSNLGVPTEDDKLYQLSIQIFEKNMGQPVHVSQTLTEWAIKYPVQSESGKLLIEEYLRHLIRLRDLQNSKPSKEDEALARKWGMSIQEIERIF